MQGSASESFEKRLNSRSYPNLVRLNSRGVLLDAVGGELLDQVTGELRDALGTAATVFEANGDYASGARPAGWCAVMDALTRPQVADGELPDAVKSGLWACRHDCWEPARRCLESGQPVELPCRGGLRVRALPVRGPDDEVIGALAVGYGAPPEAEAELAALAERLGVPAGPLVAEAERSRHQAPLTPLVDAGLVSVTRLLGALVGRVRSCGRQRRGEELLVGIAAHDLRSPLTAVLMTCHVLERTEDEQRRQLLVQRIAHSAESAVRLVEELLDVSRVRLGGELPIAPKEVRADEVCRSAIEELREAHPDARVLLEAVPVALYADPDRLGELVTNLAWNCCLHGDGGPVEVRLSADEQTVRLVVRNGGPPIPPELVEALFDPLDAQKQRLRRQAGHRGLGLGLYIAREIARAHGGTIELHSEAGQGTEISVALPRRRTA